jgi:hypothetical protein
LLQILTLSPGKRALVELLKDPGDSDVLVSYTSPQSLRRMRGQDKVYIHLFQSPPNVFTTTIFLSQAIQGALDRCSLRWVIDRGFMLSLTPDPVVLFGYIDELEVDRERPRYLLKFSGAELFYPVPKFAILVGIIEEPEALTHQPDVFLSLVESKALLLDQDPPQDAAQEVYISSQGLVLGREIYSGRESSILNGRDIHLRRLSDSTAIEQNFSYEARLGLRAFAHVILAQRLLPTDTGKSSSCMSQPV